jgi:hypothetical protein
MIFAICQRHGLFVIAAQQGLCDGMNRTGRNGARGDRRKAARETRAKNVVDLWRSAENAFVK